MNLLHHLIDLSSAVSLFVAGMAIGFALYWILLLFGRFIQAVLAVATALMSGGPAAGFAPVVGYLIAFGATVAAAFAAVGWLVGQLHELWRAPLWSADYELRQFVRSDELGGLLFGVMVGAAITWWWHSWVDGVASAPEGAQRTHRRIGIGLLVLVVVGVLHPDLRRLVSRINGVNTQWVSIQLATNPNTASEQAWLAQSQGTQIQSRADPGGGIRYAPQLLTGMVRRDRDFARAFGFAGEWDYGPSSLFLWLNDTYGDCIHDLIEARLSDIGRVGLRENQADTMRLGTIFHGLSNELRWFLDRPPRRAHRGGGRHSPPAAGPGGRFGGRGGQRRPWPLPLDRGCIGRGGHAARRSVAGRD